MPKRFSMRPHLLNIEDMPKIEGLQVPKDLYTVVTEPARLAGMRRPSPVSPWAKIKEAGFLHVVCLLESDPTYDPAPLSIVHAVKLDDLVGGKIPENPEREAALIREAVNAGTSRLEASEGVVVHCWGGTGRTGTVLGCILRNLGYDAEEVVTYLGQLNRTGRSPSKWPESMWQEDLVRSF